MIEVFKIVKGFDNEDFRNFFHLSTTGLRGHSLKIFKPFKHDVGKYTFSNRVIDSWNRLPENIIDCESLDNFHAMLYESPADVCCHLVSEFNDLLTLPAVSLNFELLTHSFQLTATG